jgi:hypothetical protein
MHVVHAPCVKHNKHTSEMYSHPDFKADLEEDRLKRAQEDDASSEGATGVRTRRSDESVASGGSERDRKRVPLACRSTH